ncbi:hypothetical protein [Cohaesibacter intestini]|uniref:hypothetical protein n=1 Tax=Cohaesibacter intestini TaxID=2211145 RepID=UPI00130065BB|nr:hypothetical protein [Cohaesibacter intestini]
MIFSATGKESLKLEKRIPQRALKIWKSSIKKSKSMDKLLALIATIRIFDRCLSAVTAF